MSGAKTAHKDVQRNWELLFHLLARGGRFELQEHDGEYRANYAGEYCDEEEPAGAESGTESNHEQNDKKKDGEGAKQQAQHQTARRNRKLRLHERSLKLRPKPTDEGGQAGRNSRPAPPKKAHRL